MTSTLEFDPSAATWQKSTYSDGSGGNCLEVATPSGSDLVPVRDSKQPEGPHVVFHARAWATFVAAL
ncbi:DUF397 domain-containing protein [Streptomyces sp. NPDC054904]